MKFYTIYKDSTGEIVQFGAIDDDGYTALDPDTGFTKAEETSLTPNDEWYYPSGVLTARPDFTSGVTITNSGGTWSANGTDTLTFSDLPDPTYIEFNVNSPAVPAVLNAEITDGSMAFTTLYPVEHVIRFRAFPYKDYTYTITAV